MNEWATPEYQRRREGLVISKPNEGQGRSIHGYVPCHESRNCFWKGKKHQEIWMNLSTSVASFQALSAALWTIVSLWIWWQLFSTSSSSFSKFVDHEFRISLLSLAVWKHTTPIGLSIFATSALETTMSERCFSASCIMKDDNIQNAGSLEAEKRIR